MFNRFGDEFDTRLRNAIGRNLSMGTIQRAGLLSQNAMIYNKAESEVMKILGSNKCNMDGFLYVINNRKFFDKMGDREYDFFIEVMPYIIGVHSEELSSLGLKPDYIELLTKLKLCRFKLSNEKLNESDLGGNFSYYHIEGPDNLTYLSFADLKINFNIYNLDVAEMYFVLTHEIFHLIDEHVFGVTGYFKSGLRLYIGNQVYFKNIDEGNVNRRAAKVLVNMIKDGRNLGRYKNIQRRTYKYAEDKVTQILSSYPEMYNAMYKGVNEFKAFEQKYNSKNRVSLKQIDNRIKLVLKDNYLQKMADKVHDILSSGYNYNLRSNVMSIRHKLQVIEYQIKTGDSIDYNIVDSIIDDMERLGIEV